MHGGYGVFLIFPPILRAIDYYVLQYAASSALCVIYFEYMNVRRSRRPERTARMDRQAQLAVRPVDGRGSDRA